MDMDMDIRENENCSRSTYVEVIYLLAMLIPDRNLAIGCRWYVRNRYAIKLSSNLEVVPESKLFEWFCWELDPNNLECPVDLPHGVDVHIEYQIRDIKSDDESDLYKLWPPWGSGIVTLTRPIS